MISSQQTTLIGMDEQTVRVLVGVGVGAMFVMLLVIVVMCMVVCHHRAKLKALDTFDRCVSGALVERGCALASHRC